MKKLIVILLIFSSPAFADQAIPIKYGEPAKFDGTLLDKEKADKLKNQLIERDEFQKLNESYQKSIDLYKSNEYIYNQENSLLLARNVDLSKTLNESKSTSDWVKVGYFVLGVGVTALAISGARQLTK